MLNFSSKQIVFFSVLVIILIGFFLRAYNFSPWLHFELDQARDARVVDAALSQGPGELPLLGPKAGGTFLRLAPGFYYLEYVSAFVFGGSPAGMAGFVLLFSVLSIPLFYFFTRRFFEVRLALGLTLLFSVSEFFVMYGRFAWNPNLIPFFVLLGLYGALRSVDDMEVHRERWFLIAVASLALATHFHFLVFLAAPAIFGAFLLLKRPRFSWKTWAGALVFVFVMYLPMALNEIETKGANTKEFFGAITEKSSKENHSLGEKALRDVAEHALHGMVIMTGFEGGTLPSFTLNNGFDWACESKCDKGKWYGVSAALVFFAGLFSLVFFWWKETDVRRKDFLLLCGIWFGVTFVLFLPLSYNIAPRFFLLSGVLFFVLLGLLLLFVEKLLDRNKLVQILVLIAIVILAGLNISSLRNRFDELSRAGSEQIKNAPDRILKDRIRVTLAQQNAIIDMLEQRSKETGFPVYMFSEPQHRRALKYLMEKRGIENAVLGFDGVYRQGVYYLVLRAQSDLEDALKKYRVNYVIGKKTTFGTLVTIELFAKPEAIIGERQDFTIPKPSDSQAPPRYTWNEFLDRNSKDSGALDESSLDAAEDSANDQQ